MALKLKRNSAVSQKRVMNKAVAPVPKRVNIRYKFAPDYNPIYANGAHGGITTQGEIVLNFYLERQPLPLLEVQALGPDGTLGAVIERDPAIDPNSIETLRFVSSGVVLGHDIAIRVRDFLTRQITELEKRGKTNKDE